MVWIAIGFLVAVSIGLLHARNQIAQMQAMVVGGRVGGPGCVIAEAIFLLLIALTMFLFRTTFS